MNPVISCSVGNASIIPGIAYSTRKNSSLTRVGLSRSYAKPGSSTRRFLFPSFVVSGVFPQNKRISSFHKKSRTSISATETEVSVEEPGSVVADKASGEIPSGEVGTSENSSPKSDANPAAAKAKRTSRTVRKSETPLVKNEELIPGATFAGKVKSIHPFGAFVNFGAFTDGLVHISMLSDGYVKDAASVVSVGQEVKVKVVEVNIETKRISLSMRQNDDASKQRRDASINIEKAGPGRRDAGPGRRDGSKPRPKKDGIRKSTKFVVGQELEGTVKNMTRTGSFISLPEQEEGFLPLSQEDNHGYANIMGKSSLTIGQKVNVRVLEINRGQATLTMKKEGDVVSNAEFEGGGVDFATNPFALAFRKNVDISAFLDAREKIQREAEKSTTGSSEEIKENVNQGEIILDTPNVQGEPQSTLTDDVPDVSSEKEEDVGASSLAGSTTAVVADESNQESIVSSPTPSIDSATDKETEVVSGSLAPEEDLSAVNPTIEEVIQTDLTTSNIKTDTPLEVPDENVAESGIDNIVAEDESQSQASDEKEQLAAATLTGSDAGSDISAPPLEVPDENVAENGIDNIVAEDESQSQASDEKEQLAAATLTESDAGSDISAPPLEVPDENVVESGIDNIVAEDGKQSQTSDEKEQLAAVAEDEKQSQSSDEKEQLAAATQTDSDAGSDITLSAPAPLETADGTEENEQVPSPESPVTDDAKSSIDNQTEEEQKQTPVAAQVEDVAIASKETVTTASATISPALVKKLREETGAGMMDCKKALSESEGDIVKAQEFLRKKGLSSADKKAARATAEGRIGSYIHDSRIGVLVEVNCETDFVARGDIFKELVDDIAMQVAACPQVEYLVTEDVPEELVNKEKEIEMQKEDLASKPEQIRSKIVEGRIRKRLEELALLEQPYIKNDKVTVKDMVKQTIATIGENMKVKRFVRFNLGEGLEKKSQDFAAEVAAQTAAKAVTTPVEAQPAVAEVKETEQKKSTVVVSASLVKQLRDETGAGMMDCKKALAETEGDLEKAQAYLRKKGLSSADKKSSRLAAEGRIGSYIHDSRIGVLIEVNCETDFVGRSEKFKELVDDLAMQVVACPQVQFVSIEDIPETTVKKEKELEMQREDLLSKPENIREKIVEGRISKRLGELALLEQPFIKDDSVLVKDLVKQSIAAIGENIKVRRFIRFTLGETNEKETTVSA